MQRLGTLWALAVGVLAGGAAAAAQDIALWHHGQPRHYLLQAPARDAPHPAQGLLLVLHGTSMRAAQMFEHTDLPALAAREGLVLAAPQALGSAFNDGLAAAGSAAAAVDDVAFIEAVAEDARRRSGVAADAVYAVGFSNGGSMVQRLAIESRYPFAGLAAVASAPRVATPGVARPVPLLLVFGQADPLNPPQGGWVWIPVPHRKPAPAATAQQWAERLQCNGPASDTVPRPGVALRLWPQCAGGARLGWMTISGLGHHWAGARPMPFPSFVLGPQVSAPALGELVWAFLASASRTSSAAPAAISAAPQPAAPPGPGPAPPPNPAAAR
jgi:polyhydroxybutyrate depolymerase